MALNSDAQGFLVGNKVELSGFGSEMDGLKNDVRSIRKSLMGRGGRDAVATPSKGSFATPSRSESSSRVEPVESFGRSGGRPFSGAAGRVGGAASEVVGGVVNTESDASVKALSEIAMPLKRGWAALRGGGTGERQEGWLKRIFGALRGERKDNAGSAESTSGKTSKTTHFERSRDHVVAGNVASRPPEFRSEAIHFDHAGRAGNQARSVAAPQGWSGDAGTGKVVSLQSIEAHLKSIDSKTAKPKGFSVLGMILPIIKLIPAFAEFMRQMRMDSNLDKIEKHTRMHNRHAFPFYAYARKRLREMGELEEAPDDGGGGGFFAMLFAPLVAIVGWVAAKFGAFGSILGGIGSIFSGFLTRMAGLSPVLAGIVAKLRGIGPALGGLFAKLAPVLKKVPVVGSLIALALGLAGSSDIENDETLTRDQKNAKEGKNWGGVAGGLGGALGGAALGTMIAGPIGTVIGGVLGAVLGDWLGGNLGEMLGSKFSAFMVPVAAGFAEIKLWALATWDWIRDGATSFYDGASKVFSTVGDFIGEKWESLTDLGKSVFDRFATAITAIYEGLKSSKIFGPLIRAAEATAAAAAALMRTAADGAIEGAKAGAGAAWQGAVSLAKSGLPAGVKDRVSHERALRTAADYKAGNIRGLDDAHTRELIASTAATESSGGKLDVVNSAGYMGRYQAGAEWLADAGLMRGGAPAVAAAMKRDGYKSQWDWGVSGGMTRYLKDEKNWNNGLSYEKYLASADVQDTAFKTNSDSAYSAMLKSGHITPTSTQEHIAGALKARHIGGIGNARKHIDGKRTPSDANGIGAAKYYSDMAGPNAQFRGAYDLPAAAAATMSAPAAPAVATTKTPAPPPPPPPPPAIAEAPQVQTQLGSGGSSKPITVQVAGTDAGQDVGDRRIAHIVTGGYAGAA